jgi:oxygen-independent coproporphyrinogen-3 oxidase
MSFDISLLKKYDKAGPRYTSYPTAPVFHEDYDSKKYIEDLEARDPKRGISLYLHLPYCDTLCYFCGCAMKVENDRSVVSSYLDLLEKEILATKKHVSSDSKIKQLHWGGGTPTHLTPAEIRRVGLFLREHFDFADDAECGVEIDPRALTEDSIVALKEVGFTRASMGLQDFDPEVQKAVNRVHDYELVSEVVGWIRNNGFTSLNLDLIYGLPLQSVESFEKTLELCSSMDVQRFAVFNYAHLPEMIKHQKLIKEDQLPTADQRLAILEMTGNYLNEKGYRYIGMDHFAKESDSLYIAQKNKTLRRNFQGYSTHADLDIIAFGSSAISQLDRVYAQNVKVIKDWREAIGQGQIPAIQRGWRLSEADVEERDLIYGLMCHFELDTAAFSKSHGCDFKEKYKDQIVELQTFFEDGCLTWEGETLKVSDHGRLVIRNIVMVFDSYLKKLQGQRPHFSRTV